MISKTPRAWISLVILAIFLSIVCASGAIAGKGGRNNQFNPFLGNAPFFGF